MEGTQRVGLVQELIYDWSKISRKRTPQIDKAFHWLLSGQEFKAMARVVVSSLMHRSFRADLGQLPLAAVVASTCVVRPAVDILPFLEGIHGLLGEIEEGVELHYTYLPGSVVLGLLKATVILTQLEDAGDTLEQLETNLWPILTKAACADVDRQGKSSFFQEGGELSNLISDYTSPRRSIVGSPKRVERRIRFMSQTLQEINGLAVVHYVFSSEQTVLTTCLLGEMVYKVFGNFSLGTKISVLANHLMKQCESSTYRT